MTDWAYIPAVHAVEPGDTLRTKHGCWVAGERRGDLVEVRRLVPEPVKVDWDFCPPKAA